MADLVDLTTDATAPAEPIIIGESPVQGYPLANNVGLQVMSPNSRTRSFSAAPFGATGLSRENNVNPEGSAHVSGIIVRPTFTRHGGSDGSNSASVVQSYLNVPVPDSQSTGRGSGHVTPLINEATVRVQEFSRTLTVTEPQGATFVASNEGTIFHSDPVELVPINRNVRRRTRSRNGSPSRVNSILETPTRNALRAELAARDSSVTELRGQLMQAQYRTAQAIQAQQDGFVQAAQIHEHRSRLVAQAETRQVHDFHESRIREINEQENKALLQLSSLECELVAARGQVLTSTSIMNSHDAAMSEVERVARDRVYALEAEVRDAVSEASRVQRERDELVQAQRNLSAAPLQNPTTRPSPIIPASPVENNEDHVQEQPPSTSSPEQNEVFLSPGETRTEVREGPFGPPPVLDEVLEDSPSIPRNARQFCSSYQRGMCLRGGNCSDIHSNDKRFTTVSYGTDSSFTKRDTRRTLSWDDHVEVANISTPSRRNKIPSNQANAISSSASHSDSNSGNCGGDANTISDQQSEIDALKSELRRSETAREQLAQEMHHAQSAIQQFWEANPQNNLAPEYSEHYIGDDDDNDYPAETDSVAYFDAFGEEGTPFTAQKSSDEKVQESEEFSSAPAAVEQVHPEISGPRQNVLSGGVRSIPGELATRSDHISTGTTNAGGIQPWRFTNVMDNLLRSMPKSNSALIPIRGERGRSLTPASVPVGMRSDYLPSAPRGLIGVSATGAKQQNSLSATIAKMPPPGGEAIGTPILSPLLSSAPVFHHKIKEVEVFVVEILPHVKFFRHWRLRFFKQIVADSGRGDAALDWIGMIETVSSIEELIETDPNWINFSAKLASGLMKILSGDLKRQITLYEEKLMAQKRTLNGRQLAFIIWDRYKREASEIGLSDFFDLREVRLMNDDLTKFLSDWDSVMFGLLNDQDPMYLLSLFEEQIKKCQHFKQSYNAYKIECTYRGLEHSYENLRYWVDKYVDQRQQEKMKTQLLQPTNSRSAAAGVGGKGTIGPSSTGKNSKRGVCYQFLENKGRCSRDPCPFDHDYEKLASYVPKKKGKGKGKSAPPGNRKGDGRSKSPKGKGKGKSSPPNLRGDRRGRSPIPGDRPPRSKSAGKRGSLQGDGNYKPGKTRAESRGKSPSGKTNAPPCALFLQGACQKGDKCDRWHIADCMFYAEGRCKAKQCIWLHRDHTGKILNLGNCLAHLAKPTAKGKAKAAGKPKAKAKSKGSAGVCIASEEFSSGASSSQLE